MLFYSSLDPQKFQKEVSHYPMTSDGFLHVRTYGIYEFRTPFLGNDQSPDTLIALDPDVINANSMESYIPLYSSNLPNPLLYVSQ